MKQETNDLFEKKRLFIIDGYGLIYRSYFAFITRPLKDSAGRNVSALFGFFNTLQMIVRQYNPEYLVVALDSKGKTFRHEMYPEYKANRDAAPEDLHAQVPRIIDILDAVGIKSLSKIGLEADDIIAYLCKKAAKQGFESIIVTGDKDLLQLVNDQTFALRPPKKGEKDYNLCGEKEVLDIFGVTPQQILDYLTILGDSSDNVPGIKGIGAKGAVKLLNQYNSLDNIFNNLDEIPKGMRKKLEDSKDTIPLSKKLIELKDDIEDQVSFEMNESKVNSWNWENSLPLLEDTGSKTLVSFAKKLLNNNSENELDFEKKETKKGEYYSLTDINQLKETLKKECSNGYLAIDLETTSIDEMEAEIVGFSFTSTEGKAWYVPLVAGNKKYIDKQDALDILSENLKDIKLVGQNIKYDLKVLRREGMYSGEIYFDTMVAAWILDGSDRRFSMDFLAEKYLNYNTIKYSDVVPKGKTFDYVSLKEATEYGAEDSDITWRLYLLFNSLLKKRNLFELFSHLEIPLISVLIDMELEGIKLDKEKIIAYGKELEKQIDQITEQIYKHCGKEFNINSPKQLQEILFDERGLTPGKKTRTGYSTDSSVLEILSVNSDDPVPGLILLNRKLAKLNNTYVDSLSKMINSTTKRVHTSFLQVGTITGRLSSANPNLQNIPIRTEEGREIRSCFIPKDGFVFVSADYSQIELVVLAHCSQDKNLMKAFIDGKDVHSETAALIFDVFPEMVTSDQRRIAKTINFGVMYGMSAFRLSQSLGISRKDASGFIKAYFEKYSEVKKFFSSVINEAKETGKVKTLLGHERIIPQINSKNKIEEAGAERIAINTKIQGTAAEIMKKAMINVHNTLIKENLKSKILLQVHDELILEVPNDEKNKVEILLKEQMEKAMILSIPLKVSVESGNNWGEMH